ncbi:MAG: 30S ribosomal protein S12 methylthiotransferase RimO [Verrucomicrobiae bacterium]|nr:30S ribosomal protein S12 methylthiotransferase RimO [Verrucomicrobiae bacterium]
MKIGIISLGCAKNLVDSEVMLGTLRKDGIEVTPNVAEADAIIVNTCSFIDASKTESINTILEADAQRGKNPMQALIVTGCLSQRYPDQLKKEMPEVDAFVGLDQITKISGIVRDAVDARRQRLTTRHSTPSTQLSFVTPKPTYIPDYATPRFRLTPKHFAYVKIAEGCNHPCSFCIIPQIRGKHRSRQQHDIVEEARQLVASGCRELNLISQDTTFYGLDLEPRRFGGSTVRAPASGDPSLCSLLRQLNAIEGDFWIRLLYTHPAHWSDELIETIATCPKVARYIDMPLQHIHEEMLTAMRRETSQQYIVDLVDSIRRGIAGIAIRTTFIVGFPGETEAHFQTLLDFIREAQFERLGVFTYSHEEGTRAFTAKNQIAPSLKKQRRDRAMKVQQKVARQTGDGFVGTNLRVLVERQTSSPKSNPHFGRTPGQPLAAPVFVGRSHADAPEIDGMVYIAPSGRAPRLGEFADVKITASSEYDLFGSLA